MLTPSGAIVGLSDFGDESAASNDLESNNDSTIGRSWMRQSHSVFSLTRSMSTQGKGKEVIPGHTSNSAAPSSTSSTASVAAKMVLSKSQNGSRSSSVDSSVVSNDSSAALTSPTSMQQPFLHAHGASRHSQGPIRQSLKLLIKPSTLGSPPRATLITSGFPQHSSKAQKLVPARTNDSPRTRSHCRFHKISLPRDERGTRVLFLVPGCSLTDRELMVEEDIQDHGDATIADSKQIVKDIESLGFSGDLIGILRQLVGVDLLREHEVFYLPTSMRKLRKLRRQFSSEKSNVLLMSSRDSPATDRNINGSHQNVNGSQHPLPVTSSQALNSTTLPSSTSSKSRKRKVDILKMDSHSGASYSNDGMSNADETPVAKSKRQKKDQPNATDEDASVNELAMETQSPAKATPKPRRSRRLGSDAAVYKPVHDTDDDSPDDDVISKSRRKYRKRGLKRAQTEHSESSQKTKKLRKHRTAT
jgi:hypothetical protein